MGIAEVKMELAKLDEAGVPVGQYKLLLEGRELSNGTALQELCVGAFQAIPLHLIKDGGHTFSRDNVSARNYDYMFKLILIGNSSSGKTWLLLRFADDIFSDCHISTIGVDYRIVPVQIDEKAVVKCHIWDTAGEERFRTITQAYYRGANGVVIVFDVTDRVSFDSVPRWREAVATNASKDLPYCIVGAKEDLRCQREVTEAEAVELAADLGAEYFEVSAKSNTNVAQPFYHLISVIFDRLQSS